MRMIKSNFLLSKKKPKVLSYWDSGGLSQNLVLFNIYKF